MKYPTQKQIAVLKVLDTYANKNSYPPSVRDLSAAVGVSSSVVHGHLTRLRDKGLVEWTPGLIRTLRVTSEASYYVNR